jgi:hypothetical protein
MQMIINLRKRKLNLIILLALMLLLLVSCAVPVAHKVDKQSIPGNPLPLATTIVFDSHSPDYYGQFKYSLIGDLRGRDRWNVHSYDHSQHHNVYHDNIKKHIWKNVNSLIKLAFDKKSLDLKSINNKQKFTLKLFFKVTYQNVDHKLPDPLFGSINKLFGDKTVSNRKRVPINAYLASVSGNLQYEFSNPEGSTIISGYTTGNGGKKTRTFNFPDIQEEYDHYGRKRGREKEESRAFGAHFDALNEAYKSAINDACMKLVNELQTNKKVALVVQNLKEKRTFPANIIANIHYSDESSFIPNNVIDAGENAVIFVNITNKGHGTAFNVVLNISTENKYIEFPSTIQVGDIQPDSTKDIEVRVSAGLELTEATIPFIVQARENRGYDSKKYVLNIPASRLDRPEIVISSYKINDGDIGLASGNGNGIPENGETIELIPFIRNNGTGKAIKVNLSISSINSGIDIKRNSVLIPQIVPNQTVTEKLSFHIPRTYSGGDIKIDLAASDIRGASKASRLLAINTKTNQPILAYSYTVLDRNKNGFLENGEEAEIEIIPSNKGLMDARNINVNIQSEDLLFTQPNMDIDRIPASSRYVPLRFSFKVPRTLQKDNVDIKVQFSQKDFSGLSDYINLPIKLALPDFKITYQILDPNNNGIIEQGESVNLIVRVSNIGNLAAEDVVLKMDINKEGEVFTNNKSVHIGRISAGNESEPQRFSLTVQRRASAGELPIRFKINQREFPSKDISLSLNIAEEQAEVITVVGEDVPATKPPIYYPSYNAPPVIAIASPKNNWKTASKSEKLIGTIVDDKGVANIEITLNGQRLNANPMRGIEIANKNKNSKRIPLEIEIPLQKARNQIVVTAYDIENLSSSETITIYRETERGEIWGVVIGINRYQNVPNLKYATRDAKEYANYLRHYIGLDSDHLIELYDEQATATEIRTILGDILNKKAYKPKDTVFIFYAGHGAPDEDPRSKDGDGLTKYILPHNAHPERLFGTAIRMDEIADIFNRIGAERIVFFADSCFSGASGGRTVIAQSSRAMLSDAFLDRLAAGKGRIILTSCSANEVSKESEEFKHGIFTYYLLKGLKGNADYDQDNEIDIDELSLYIKKQVRKETNGAQTPVMKGDAEGQVVVGVVK